MVQYEVKFQKEHECGGAYLKLLTYDPNFNPALFDDKTPYTISSACLLITSSC